MNAFKAWYRQPLSETTIKKYKWFYVFAIYAGVAAICVVNMLTRGLDIDSYYIITQGEEIARLNNVPRINTVTFLDDYKIIVQQWLYCLLMYKTKLYAGNTGLIILGLIQQLYLFGLIQHILSKRYDDKIITYGLTALICISVKDYFCTLRAENITLILLLLQCNSLDNYIRTKKQKYLYQLPIWTLLEINLHASMWIFHFCVILAYIVPNIFKNNIDHYIKINKHVITSIGLMGASLFINPYGIDCVTYVFKSLHVFNYIDIKEQQNTEYATFLGITLLVTILLTLTFYSLKILKSSTFYLSIGFAFLATTSYHSTMFILIAQTYLICDLCAYMKTKNLQKICHCMKNDVCILAIALNILAISITGIIYVNYIHKFDKIEALDQIIEYVKENNPDGHILNMMDAGSYLEYNDIKNILMDTRPELMSEKINEQYNMILDIYVLSTHYMMSEHKDYYGNYLNKYDIQYILDYASTPAYAGLSGYLSGCDNYQVVMIVDNYILYERIDKINTK